MLFAHWLYWGAAIIGVPEMLSPAKEKEEEGDAESPPDLTAVQVALHKPGTHDVEQSPSGDVFAVLDSWFRVIVSTVQTCADSSYTSYI